MHNGESAAMIIYQFERRSAYIQWRTLIYYGHRLAGMAMVLKSLRVTGGF